MPAQLPQPLKKDATIGLICPAGGFDDYKPINRAVKYLKRLGYRVKLGKSLICPSKLGKNYKYLSGSDKERITDFLEFWNDKNIDAIFCLRGGYGSLRLLDRINFKFLKKRKKIILGFSDITVLLLSVYAKCNLVTFHGPMLGYNFIDKKLNPVDSASEKYMWSLLKSLQFSYSFKHTTSVITAGKAVGILLGGNLTDICSMIGSKYLPDFKGSIFFLEDCNEEPYKIDRLLTQLSSSGLLKGVKALIFSNFYKCKFSSKDQILNLLKDKFSNYNIPIIYDFPIGHGLKNYCVPIGMNVLFDTKSGVLKSL